MNRLRHLLIAMVALVLVAALVFLYQKTQAVDLGDRNDIAALLDTLREMDTRWDIDVLRERAELDANRIAAPNRTAAAQKALATLSAAAPRADSAALSEGLGELSKAILEKADLVEKYKAENASAKIALHALLSGAAAIAAQAGELRQDDARQKQVQQALNQLAAAAQQYYWLGKAAPPLSLEMAAGEVRNLAMGIGEGARGQISAIDGAIQELLKHKPVEEELFTRVSSLSSGPRLDKMRFSFNRELDATLQVKELFRVYLLAYAAALLIGVGYLGIRLKAANESLERRVVERTRELSEALRHLKESEAQLIQSEKMSSLGQMVAGVAHEINTPLGIANHAASIVTELAHDLVRAPLPDASRETLDDMLAASRLMMENIARADRLVQTFKTLSVNQAVDTLDDVNLVQLTQDTVDLYRLKARASKLAVSVLDRLGDHGDKWRGYPGHYAQIILNLLTNVDRYAYPDDQGGKVEIEIGLDHNTSRPDRYAVIVRDFGRGVAPENLERIFEPFYTTGRGKGGTGLGLPIVKNLVTESLQGEIDVASPPGAGLDVRMRLPLNVAPAPHAH
jgi:signal transduction histidine kinase